MFFWTSLTGVWTKLIQQGLSFPFISFVIVLFHFNIQARAGMLIMCLFLFFQLRPPILF